MTLVEKLEKLSDEYLSLCIDLGDRADSVKAQQVKELFAQYEVTLKELEKLSLKDLIELTSAIKKL